MKSKKDTVAGINKKISKLPSSKRSMVSDGYHTFDELYEHRCVLFLTLLNVINSTTAGIKTWKSRKNSDGSEWPGWFVCGIEAGVTYHLPDRLWHLLEVEEIEQGLWDGHTSDQVPVRLLMVSKTITSKDEEE